MNLREHALQYYTKGENEIISLQDFGEYIFAAARWFNHYFIDIHHETWLQNHKSFYSVCLNDKKQLEEHNYTYPKVYIDDRIIKEPDPRSFRKLLVVSMSELLFCDREKLRTLYLALLKEQDEDLS